MADTTDPWSLRHLVLRTPRLELRPDDDAGLLELVEEILLGIHPPESMPFGVAWTDAPRDELGINTMRHYWSMRAALRAHDWTINFLVRRDGRVIGTQALTGRDFRITRTVSTGSWVGRRHQGRGYGTEMRSAVLQLAFDHLGAEQARSTAFTDNVASLGVSRRLGYREDGTERQAIRGGLATQVRLLLTAEAHAAHRPPWRVAVDGLVACLPLLDR
jgi:RimJ/RimL family protein N-acetyltransferase